MTLIEKLEQLTKDGKIIWDKVLEVTKYISLVNNTMLIEHTILKYVDKTIYQFKISGQKGTFIYEISPEFSQLIIENATKRDLVQKAQFEQDLLKELDGTGN